MKKLAILTVHVLSASMLFGQVIHIPSDYPTIQEGINAANPGDTVLVSPGTYMENIIFMGKNITVASLFLTTQDTAYISQTIIDGDSAGSVVTFENGEDSSAVLIGFSIKNGQNYSGGGIRCLNSSPSLSYLNIYNNIAHYGGGISFDVSNSTLENVKIENNTTFISGGWYGDRGGGIYCGSGSNLMLKHIIIKNNTALEGGGIYCDDYDSLVVENGSITNNNAGNGGGIYCFDSGFNSFLYLKNVIIANNIATNSGGGIYFFEGSAFVFDTISRCNIYLNEAMQGNDLYCYTFSKNQVHVVVDTFSVYIPTSFYAVPLENFSFDILHEKIPQVDADLYVSPSGDDSNSGFTPQEPLKTMHHAFSFIFPDTITPNTIHLMEGTYSHSLTGEIFPVSVPGNINITGVSRDLVILDGEDTSQVLLFNGNRNSMISNITIKGGTGENGAGIYGINSSPVLQNMIVTGNNASGWGAGIYFSNSSPALVNVTVESNYARDGGGIYCSNSLMTLQNVVIKNNTAYMDGSGLYCLGSNLTMEDGAITNNSAGNSGGGIFITGNSAPFFKEVNISGNSVPDSSYHPGGGIYCENSSPVFEDVTITQNVAGYGGGMCCLSDAHLEHVFIHDNKATFSGGGLYGSNLYLKDVTISFNKLTDKNGKGGGIWSWGFTVFDTVDRCNIYDNEAALGNDLYSAMYHINLVVDTFTVSHPTGFYAQPAGSFSFDILHGKYPQVDADLFISPVGNDANSGLTESDPLKTLRHAFSIQMADSLHRHTIFLGEGTYSETETGESFPVIVPDFMSITGKAATDVILDDEGKSSVMWIQKSNATLISRMTIKGGNAHHGGGGGVCCEWFSNPVLDDLIITDNMADQGGGIYVYYYSNPELKNLMIHNNTANYFGGGIHCDDNSDPFLENVLITDNSAYYDGGGVCMEHSLPVVNNVVVAGNFAEEGGGIYCSSSNPELKNVLISNNYASSNGGGIYCDFSHPVFKNATVTGNYAETGGGISSVTSVIHLWNTILWNEAAEEVYFNPNYPASSITVSYSDIQGGENGILTNNNGTVTWLAGNSQEYPLFEGMGEHPYALSDGSPCIDAGTPDTTGLSLPPWDILGNVRIWDGDGDGVDRVDMGAYEFGALPVGIEKSAVGSRQLAVGSYPNPFNSSVVIEYELEENSTVTLTIFDYLGQQVKVLVNEVQAQGTHQMQWDAGDLPAGVYYYHLKVGKQMMSGKIVKMQ